MTRAVITCPAVFDEVEKDRLREAALQAGFLEVELLEEPVAAATAYAGRASRSAVTSWSTTSGEERLIWLC